MGAPKQKWTTEEEAALKAGVVKHGAGKWRTILKDPEFSTVLCLRSNVDLKDKWRNMSVMANGLGSREKTRLALKKLCNVPTDENTVSSCTTIPGEDEIVNAKPLAMASSSMEIDGPKRSIVRLDNLILDAIMNLKEHGGSNKSTIAAYIEDQYWTPPNFKRLLSAKLKFLTACGKIVKVKRKYRVAPPSGYPDRRKNSPPLLLEGRPRASPMGNREEVSVPSKAEIDVELAKIRGMSPQDAAAAAARAVAEAEATIAEAEEAAREAEAAEADAEAAQAFAEAAMKTLKGRSCTAPLTMVRG